MTMTRQDLPLLDMSEPAFWQDVHTPLTDARERSPLARSTDGVMYVLRHEDLEFVLKDPRFIAADLLAMNGLAEGPVWEWWQKVMFSKNPPEHTRLRTLVSRAFTPRSVNALRPAIRARVEQILDPAFEGGRVDAQGDLGHRLPLAVISDLLDLPEDDRPAFGEWTAALGVAFGAASDVQVRAHVERSLEQIEDYVGGLIALRRRAPGVDLISQLIAVEENGDRLSTSEMVALIENLMFAGHDTTRGALAVMLVLFARNPDQYAAVRADPGLIPRAVDEVLRYEPVTFTTSRLAAQDVEIGGIEVSAGEPLALSIASACRDPRKYPDPHRFDVQRQDVRSTTFGAGIHYCLGAGLARAEMEEALALLVSRTSAIELDAEPQWLPFHHIRSFEPPVWAHLAR
jgi:cytochrome P450